MIEFGGIYYYIDIDALEKLVYVPHKEGDAHVTYETTTKTLADNTLEQTIVETRIPKVREVDFVKYEIIRNCIEIILDSDDQGDTELGAESALEKMPMAYKVAFNTLYKYEIIKEQE